MKDMLTGFNKNRTRIAILAALAFLLFSATQGMEPRDWALTLFRGLSVGAVTFLVASGLSIIFGLMDVLNLAHGAFFMLGAYVGWSVYVRPDTFVDLLTPIVLVAAGFALTPLWEVLHTRLKFTGAALKIWSSTGLLIGAALLLTSLLRYPLAIWNPSVYSDSPITWSLRFDQGNLAPEPASAQGTPAFLILSGIFLGGALAAFGLAGATRSQMRSTGGQANPALRLRLFALTSAALVVAGFSVFYANDALTASLLALDTTWLFALALVVATLTGALIGALTEVVLIRPLYARPIYQLMLTLGLAFIITEFVRAVWGRPEVTVPRPSLFNATGEGCPATSVGEWLSNGCSTLLFMDSRVRTYNEIFIILVGVLVLAGVWIAIQRSRLGMIVRAGVQDREMVEALGINVRKIFTLVFSIGVGLAALGGAMAGPSMGLSNGMGENLLLLALISLAIGGLTSFPGAAAGAVIVGVLQQFLIRYGQIGINIPFVEQPFKPTPPLIPASTVLLMVVILLILPQGLFGRKE